MKPVRSFFPLASWLMRLAIVLYAFLRYLDVVVDFDLGTVIFYIALLQVVFATLLFVGGFVRKHSLTVVSALILLIVTVYQSIVVAGGGLTEELAVLILYATVALYFLTKGNGQ
jgi:hypothetical protein